MVDFENWLTRFLSGLAVVEPEIDLLAIQRGSITAPAGCGKTQLIADAMRRHAATKPVLVLTHTNAGVGALRARLNRAGIPSKSYRLTTIDGWAIKLISIFPGRSGHDPSILGSTTDYAKVRRAASGLLDAGHVTEIIASSYARLIVDEYQDCSVSQHSIVLNASRCLPTVVLGDPMQAIFGFGSNTLARWREDVCESFPHAGELSTPWRWRNAGCEALGQWLLDARKKLERGDPLDLRGAVGVRWVPLDGTSDHARRLEAARVDPPDGDGSVLVIADSKKPAGQQDLARQLPGAVTVEAVDLRDLIGFANEWDVASGNALTTLVHFAEKVMIHVGAADLLARVQSLVNGTARKAPTDAERAALSLLKERTYSSAATLLVEIGKQPAVRTHRPAVLRACLKALQGCDGSDGNTFRDAAIRQREQNRVLGRPLPKRAVGSTLLLKGLEAEVVVVLHAGDLDANNLYVAMTRGSQLVVVCCPNPVLNPGM
jgi:hypothetical protein